MHPVPRKFSQTAEKRCLVGMDRTPQPRLLLLFWRHTPYCFRPAPTHQYAPLNIEKEAPKGSLKVLSYNIQSYKSKI